MDARLLVHVINLDRSPDRLAEFSSVNSHLGCVMRISAVDGQSVHVPELISNGTFQESVIPQYSPGAIGNALSHLTAWEKAIASGQPLTVCEDDAIFNHHFYESALSVLSECPPDWDIVLWGWNFDTIFHFELLPDITPCFATFNQEVMIARAQAFPPLRLKPHPVRLFRAFGAVCYTISPKGARLLRSFCLPIREMTVLCNGIPPIPNRAIDVMMAEAFPRFSAWASFPPLVITKNDKSRSQVFPRE